MLKRKNRESCQISKAISFSAGSTYEIILATHVHAHPFKKGFPKEATEYVLFRRKGGIMEYVFRVKKTVDLYISNLNGGSFPSSSILDDNEKSRIFEYVDKRCENGFGFKWQKDYPYRFYLLEIERELNPPLIKSPNIQSYFYYDIDEVFGKK